MRQKGSRHTSSCARMCWRWQLTHAGCMHCNLMTSTTSRSISSSVALRVHAAHVQTGSLHIAQFVAPGNSRMYIANTGRELVAPFHRCCMWALRLHFRRCMMDMLDHPSYQLARASVELSDVREVFVTDSPHGKKTNTSTARGAGTLTGHTGAHRHTGAPVGSKTPGGAGTHPNR